MTRVFVRTLAKPLREVRGAWYNWDSRRKAAIRPDPTGYLGAKTGGSNTVMEQIMDYSKAIELVATVFLALLGWVFAAWQRAQEPRNTRKNRSIDKVNNQLDKLANLVSWYRLMGTFHISPVRNENGTVRTDSSGRATIETLVLPELRFQHAVRSTRQIDIQGAIDALAVEIRLAADEVTDILDHYDPSGQLTSQYAKLFYMTESVQKAIDSPDWQAFYQTLKDACRQRADFIKSWNEAIRPTLQKRLQNHRARRRRHVRSR